MNKVFIGTEDAMREFRNTSFNSQTTGTVLLSCFANTETLYFYDNNSALTGNIESYVVEVSSNQNPFTDSTYPFNDPLKNTTAFARDNTTYPDYNDINVDRYQLTSIGVNEFSRTFPQNDLMGSQFGVASMSFHIQELGHKITVVIHKEENFLLQFCQQQNWNYFRLN